MTETARFQIPQGNSKLTGTTVAHVTAYKMTTSKVGGEPQVEFTFTTRKGNTFLLWMTITSAKQVKTFLQAGILRKVGLEEFEVTPLGLQPEMWVALRDGKLEQFIPLDAATEED